MTNHDFFATHSIQALLLGRENASPPCALGDDTTEDQLRQYGIVPRPIP